MEPALQFFFHPALVKAELRSPSFEAWIDCVLWLFSVCVCVCKWLSCVCKHIICVLGTAWMGQESVLSWDCGGESACRLLV